jgi:hypothetical protein
MALRTYRQWALENSPTWLRGPWGEKLVTTIGGIFDEAYGAAFQAGAAGSVGAPTFPNDALALVGSERNIERYPAETDAEYKTRVKGAWESWQQAGTMRIVSELAYLGFTAEIKENWDWDWDGDEGTNWSRFWVVITGHDFELTRWGDGRKWGEGVWGCDATVEEANALLRLVRKWKPGHTFPITIIVLNEDVWDTDQPDGTWGDPANRSTWALYHYER